MSRLIDKFICESIKNQTLIKGTYYIAKPLPDATLKNKLKDCIKILNNKAVAVHYKEDEK